MGVCVCVCVCVCAYVEGRGCPVDFYEGGGKIDFTDFFFIPCHAPATISIHYFIIIMQNVIDVCVLRPQDSLNSIIMSET